MIRLPAFHFSLVLAASLGLGACASSTGPGPADPDGSAFAQARAAYLAEDYPRALALMRSEAALGNPRAQYTLGYMYYHGQGVPQDMEQALQWIRQAAAQGKRGRAVAGPAQAEREVDAALVAGDLPLAAALASRARNRGTGDERAWDMR